MNFLNTLKSFGESLASFLSEEKGAYWCKKCDERKAGPEKSNPPGCPSCGEKMDFEKKPPEACC